MKKRSTRESCVFTAAFHWYITWSIPVSEWRAMRKKWIKRQGPIFFCYKFKSYGRRKLKKLLWERFVQKEYHLCNTDEWMRKSQTKIRHRSSTWKQQEVQLLRWMNFRWKTFKIAACMKKRSTRESCVFTSAFHRYITCLILVSVPVSGWRAASRKSTWKTEWSSGTCTEKFRSSRDAFSKNMFRGRSRTNDPAVFGITWKRLGIRENHQHEKVSHFL